MSDAASFLRDARRRHGLDQRALARRAGTSQTQISRIERGVVSPTVASLARLLGALGEQLELAYAPTPHPGTRGYLPDHAAERRREYATTTPAQRLWLRSRSAALSRGSLRGSLSPLIDGEIQALDADTLLRALQAHDVEYVVIGGLAVAAHGYVRATRTSTSCRGRPGQPTPAVAALRSLEAGRSRSAISSAKSFLSPSVPRASMREETGRCARRTDVWTSCSGWRDRVDSLWADALRVELPEVGEVLFAGYDHVVAMKRAAGRPDDRPTSLASATAS